MSVYTVNMEYIKGELRGKVEIPKDGWFHDWAMRKVLKGINFELNKYPLGHEMPHTGIKQDKSWTTSNFKPKYEL